MTNLTTAAVLSKLSDHTHKLVHRQQMEPNHPDRGGLVNPEYDLPDNKLSSAFVVACAYLNLHPETESEMLLERAALAMDFVLRAQRPSGNIDLISVNYDSSPDTGFTVQQLCTVVELARAKKATGPQWHALLERIEQFVRRAVPGISTGGFHTPNHRWVMVSALVQAKTLYPDLEANEIVDDIVATYLAEGYDVDEEGAFLERSVGVYDAVNTRSLLLIAENWHSPDALDAVNRNLDLDLYLLHADGSAETGLSRRQDYGTRTVPLGIAHCYLLSHHAKPNDQFVAAARTLWQQSQQPGEGLTWLAYPLLKFGDPPRVEAQLPNDYARHFPRNGIWRVRRGLLSASIFRGATRTLTLVHGDAELTSMKISATYFGGACGRFSADEMTVEGDRAQLVWKGLGKPRRPGYELPLGRPVPPEKWGELLPERDLRRLPPLQSVLSVCEMNGGFDLHFRTVDGLDEVAVQIAFDFPEGGVWETDDTRLRPRAGQVIFLKQGQGAMRFGDDVIRIGPGAYGHGMFAMREAEPAPDHVRVLVTFRTPVDYQFSLRAWRGLAQPA